MAQYIKLKTGIYTTLKNRRVEVLSKKQFAERTILENEPIDLGIYATACMTVMGILTAIIWAYVWVNIKAI